MVKCLPEFEYFTVFLKNKNIIFKIRRSKVTDYAALRAHHPTPFSSNDCVIDKQVNHIDVSSIDVRLKVDE